MVTELAANILADHSGQPSVLVVEDELFVRWAISEALRDAGYNVIEAVNGDEAVSIIQTGVQLDLVFSDVRMPGVIDGLALLEFINRVDPGIPVLVTSGHCEPALALGGGAAGFVRKPYEIDALLGLVRDQLGKSE